MGCQLRNKTAGALLGHARDLNNFLSKRKVCTKTTLKKTKKNKLNWCKDSQTRPSINPYIKWASGIPELKCWRLVWRSTAAVSGRLVTRCKLRAPARAAENHNLTLSLFIFYLLSHDSKVSRLSSLAMAAQIPPPVGRQLLTWERLSEGWSGGVKQSLVYGDMWHSRTISHTSAAATKLTDAPSNKLHPIFDLDENARLNLHNTVKRSCRLKKNPTIFFVRRFKPQKVYLCIFFKSKQKEAYLTWKICP